MAHVKPRKVTDNEREERIRAALQQRRDEGTPWATLALEYGIAGSTLNDRWKGARGRREAHSEQQKLPPMAEKALERWCQQLDDWGFPPRMDMLREMANILVRQRAEQEGDPRLAVLGKNWITRFLDRYPDLAGKFSTQIDRQRVFANNPIILHDYFNKLQKLLRKHRFLPENIWNMDEKGFSLGFSSRAKVICRAARRNPHVAQDGSREMLMVLELVSVLGMALPPFVVYKGKGHYMGWHLETDDPNARFAYSKNGWTDDQLGLAWLCKHFEPKTYTNLPRLLILDGHGSHITWQFCQFALERNIQIICLPAHSTHLLQPLDVGIFGPLQHYYGKAADTHMRDTRTGVKKGTFWIFYSEARGLTFLPKKIQSAFRATGIVPFNPNKVLVKVTKITKTTTPNSPTAIFTTPRNRHQLRQQALAATSFFPSSPTSSRESYLAVVLRLADLTERALTEVEIAKAEAQRLREGYEGKRAAKADRRVLSKVRIITGEDIIRLREEWKTHERSKSNQRPTKKKTTRLPPSTPPDSSPSHSAPRVQIVETPKVIEFHASESESEDGYQSSGLSDTSTPTTSHHPILSPRLSTPTNSNRRLPDRPLEMRLRSRR